MKRIVLLLAVALGACAGFPTYYKPGSTEFDKHYSVFQCQQSGARTPEKEHACMAADGWVYR